MLKIQFKHDYTKNYQDLRAGDIFINPDFVGHAFIYTDSNHDNLVCEDCIDLTTGLAYNFAAGTPIIIVNNAKLIIEEE